MHFRVLPRSAPTVYGDWRGIEDVDEMFSVLVRDRRIRPLKPSRNRSDFRAQCTVNAQSNSHEEREPTH